MSAAPPRISVVVTCYNLGRYLDEAIDSVLAQTFQDFEIVIVNDGSTDPATCALLSAYQRPKTRVVHSENRGLSAARNLGIRESAGPLVCALDADDKLEATWFEKAVRVLDDDPSLTFVSHWLRNFGDEDGDWTPEACDLPSMLRRNVVNGAALVRRDALDAVGGFDESMTDGCEDWDLWLTMIEAGFRGTIIPEVLFFYRRRADSMSRLMKNGHTHARLFRRLVEKHRQSYQRHLADVLREKDAGIAHLLRETSALAFDHDAMLAPAIRRAQEEVAALEAKVARLGLGQSLAATRNRLDEAEREVAALRDSLSWRLTAPLRTAAEWLLRLRGRVT
jgi:glycosyltransferase involved in cell wall biosynthesis